VTTFLEETSLAACSRTRLSTSTRSCSTRALAAPSPTSWRRVATTLTSVLFHSTRIIVAHFGSTGHRARDRVRRQDDEAYHDATVARPRAAADGGEADRGLPPPYRPAYSRRSIPVRAVPPDSRRTWLTLVIPSSAAFRVAQQPSRVRSAAARRSSRRPSPSFRTARSSSTSAAASAATRWA
jgi:hypothetical protein